MTNLCLDGESKGVLKGIIPLENVAVRQKENDKKQFELYQEEEGHTIKAAKMKKGKKAMVPSNHENFEFQAANAEERAEWMEAIEAHVQHDAFHSLLRGKRKQLMAEVQTRSYRGVRELTFLGCRSMRAPPRSCVTARIR